MGRGEVEINLGFRLRKCLPEVQRIGIFFMFPKLIYENSISYWYVILINAYQGYLSLLHTQRPSRKNLVSEVALKTALQIIVNNHC